MDCDGSSEEQVLQSVFVSLQVPLLSHGRGTYALIY